MKDLTVLHTSTRIQILVRNMTTGAKAFLFIVITEAAYLTKSWMITANGNQNYPNLSPYCRNVRSAMFLNVFKSQTSRILCSLHKYPIFIQVDKIIHMYYEEMLKFLRRKFFWTWSNAIKQKIPGAISESYQ